ncbi:MAG: PAS domain S-box protein [Candidatus Riflebacteria bacterium]|nr:PAS domain S-box protein [Candidatus Riflebacteria bacterium]
MVLTDIMDKPGASAVSSDEAGQEVLDFQAEKLKQAILYKVLFDQSMNGEAVADADTGILLECNETLARMVGRSREELIGQPQTILHPPQVGNSSFKRHLTMGGETIETQIITKEGIVRDVEIKSNHINISGRRLFHGEFHDITERKLAEEALRESERKHRTLLETLPQKIFLKDINSVYISCNENFAGDLRIRTEEIAGRTDYDFFPKELADKYRGDDKEVVESGKAKEVEEKYIRDGGPVFVHTIKTPLKDGQGNIIGVLGIFHDITKRKKAEEALRESEERYRQLFEHAPFGIGLATLDGKVLAANKMMDLIMGCSTEELKAVNLANTYVNPSDRVELISIVKKFGHVVDFPTKFKRRDGTEFDVSLTVGIVDIGGTVLQTQVQDITERKKAEEKLREANRALGAAKEKAEELNRLKDQLLHNTHHELRTPLNSIMGFAGVISASPEATEKIRDQAKIIHRSGKNLLNIINDILTLARIDAGSEQIIKVPINLYAILRGIGELLAKEIQKNQIEFEIEYPASSPKTFLADGEKIQQIISNLTNNAVKFTQHGQVKIKVDCGEIIGDTVECLISVSDTGVGIPKEKLHLLFQRFSQVDGSSTRKYGGNGLGLAISQSLTRLMGGEIKVTSEFGKGTTFTLRIPLTLILD